MYILYGNGLWMLCCVYIYIYFTKTEDQNREKQEKIVLNTNRSEYIFGEINKKKKFTL